MGKANRRQLTKQNQVNQIEQATPQTWWPKIKQSTKKFVIELMQKILFTFLLMCFTFSSGLIAQTKTVGKTVSNSTAQKAKTTAATQVNWLTVQEAEKKMKENPKKLFVDLYTSWCGWCKRMDATTFKDPTVVKMLNEDYYAVKFNAETKETIEFAGKTYKYVAGGRRGYNELAQFFLGNKMSYPSFALFDEGGTKLTVIPGYHEADKFEVFLDFFKGNYHRKMPFADFEQKRKAGTLEATKTSSSKSTSNPTGAKAATNQTEIDWITIEEAQRLMGFAPKKVFIDVYTDWCGWCKRMDKSTFAHPDIVKYMNANYYCVKLDAEHKKDIEFGGKTYKYIAEGKKGYNQLAALLLNGQMSFPSYVVFDEAGARADILAGYKKTDEFDTLMKFYAENHYKEKDLNAFKEEYKSPLVPQN